MATYKPIPGRDFIAWLATAGIDVDQAYRVIVDAQVGDIVRIYIERFGDERMISVSPAVLSGAQIITEPRGAEKKAS